MEDVQEQQKPEVKVETVENNEQEQNENENQAQTQNNDEQSEEDIEKRKKYENEQIARINLIFGKPTDLQKLYEEYEKEFQVIAQKRAETKSSKKSENDNNKSNNNNNNDNETQESESKTAEKELKDAEKEFAGRWGLNSEELSDKIEVLQVGCVATVVPQHLTFKEKEERNNVLKKAMEINLYKKLPEFAKFLQVRGIDAKLEQFGDDMAKFDPGCDAEAVSYFLDEFCELEKQKEEIKAQKEKEEREKKEKESIKDKAKDAKKEADEQSENNEPKSEQPNSERAESDDSVPDLKN